MTTVLPSFHFELLPAGSAEHARCSGGPCLHHVVLAIAYIAVAIVSPGHFRHGAGGTAAAQSAEQHSSGMEADAVRHNTAATQQSCHIDLPCMHLMSITHGARLDVAATCFLLRDRSQCRANAVAVIDIIRYALVVDTALRPLAADVPELVENFDEVAKQ
jgi:hypothetical protein